MECITIIGIPICIFGFVYSRKQFLDRKNALGNSNLMQKKYIESNKDLINNGYALALTALKARFAKEGKHYVKYIRSDYYLKQKLGK